MERGYFSRRLFGSFKNRRWVAGLLYVIFSPVWLILEFILLAGGQRKEYGKRPFVDDSQNNLILAFLTLGESIHNNHHYDPRCSYHGHKWNDIDPSKWFLMLFQIKVGGLRLIWKPERPRSVPVSL
jgi:stearoyl-CoA desaturase (delta-9 desaturase)